MVPAGRGSIENIVAKLSLCVICALGWARPCLGYGVIMHSAIIDAEWDSQLRPFLLKRFPQATPAQLRLAKSYAYGGAVLQDMGYYPLCGKLFSHFTHYVRTGDFVAALFAESRDINDYAFALGALSHYCADIQGHSLGVNLAVPILYPRLRRKYGKVMTWEDSPYAHVLTEFGFDTLEVVAGHVAPLKYHDYVGFRVPKPLLLRAFQTTYGLDWSRQTLWVRLSLWSYRRFAGKVLPEMTKVAWALRAKALERRAKSVQHRELFHLRRPVIEASWERTRRKPGLGDKTMALLFRLVPKVGPFDAFQFHTPTPQTEKLLANSLRATIADYELRIANLPRTPPDLNLDTGRATRPGEYRHCDYAYAQLLHKLERQHFAGLTPGLRENLLSFYIDSTNNSVREKHRQWRRVQSDLEELKATPVATADQKQLLSVVKSNAGRATGTFSRENW